MENNQKIFNVRTDLAYDEKNKGLVDFEETIEVIDQVKITKHTVGQEASKEIGKRCGNYYTIDLANVCMHDTATCERIEKCLAKLLIRIIKELKLEDQKALLVGLGNINVTPDSLGPYVMDNVIVTRHLFETNHISEGFNNVCAISPGVMGTTGIETFDIVKSVIDKVDIDYVIVVDALATNSITRINKTIQVTDTGINPGSGVGNKRKELSIDTLGVPVIAIGVPTVVDAVAITSDAIKYILKYLYDKASSIFSDNQELPKKETDLKNVKEKIFGHFGLLSDVEKSEVMKTILEPNGYNMMVTPKEVDADIEDLTKIIANAINLSLHPGLFNGMSE